MVWSYKFITHTYMYLYMYEHKLRETYMKNVHVQVKYIVDLLHEC